MAASVVFLVAYAAPIMWPELPGAAHSVAAGLVWVTWAVFLVDYVARLLLATDRLGFIRGHLVDLAVVALPVLRPLRLLRLVTVLRFAQRHATHLRVTVGTYAAGGTALLVFVGGLAITDAERGHPDALITTVTDGWWWAFVSMTTVGYGDTYPVTGTGRLVAVALMLGGIALLGTVTGMVTSWLVEHIPADERTSGQDGI